MEIFGVTRKRKGQDKSDTGDKKTKQKVQFRSGWFFSRKVRSPTQIRRLARREK